MVVYNRVYSHCIYICIDTRVQPRVLIPLLSRVGRASAPGRGRVMERIGAALIAGLLAIAAMPAAAGSPGGVHRTNQRHGQGREQRRAARRHRDGDADRHPRRPDRR